MSHTRTYTTNVNVGGLLPVQLLIQDYTSGGELVSLADVPGANSVSGVVFGTVPSSQNSLGTPLIPVLDAGKIRLYQFTTGSPVEVITTIGLNATVTAIVLAK